MKQEETKNPSNAVQTGASPGDESIRARKQALRERMLAKRAGLDSDYVRSAGESIQSRLLGSEKYAEAQSIFVYVSVGNEPPTGRIIQSALRDGKRVYVPKCVSRHEMKAVRIRSTEDLMPGTLGIPEPKEITQTAAPADLDLLIVPCVAAAPNGRRLGHGAGYYDRFLKEGAEKAVCLCFRKMLRGSIPTEAHDVAAAWVLTEAPIRCAE